MVSMTVLHYAASGMRPELKDRLLRLHFPPQTATTMLMSTTALQMQNVLQTGAYPNRPDNCPHLNGLRRYGAGGYRVSICDQCGARWVVEQTGTMVSVRAKASPTATTPMDLPPTLKNRAKASTKAKSTASSDGSLLRLEHLQLRQTPWRPTMALRRGPSAKAMPTASMAPTCNAASGWRQQHETASEMSWDQEYPEYQEPVEWLHGPQSPSLVHLSSGDGGYGGGDWADQRVPDNVEDILRQEEEQHM